MNEWYEYIFAFLICLAGCVIVGLLLDHFFPLS